MSNEDDNDYEGSFPTNPLQLAIAVQKLRGDLKAVRMANEELTTKVESQEKAITALEAFKSELKTGARVIAILGSFTIALAGAILAFCGNIFSGKGFHGW